MESWGSVGKEWIAVLDLKSRAGAKDSKILYLTSLLRQAASRLPTSRFSVMTKDNILVLLPPSILVSERLIGGEGLGSIGELALYSTLSDRATGDDR
jgi:hypothetical protein